MRVGLCGITRHGTDAAGQTGYAEACDRETAGPNHKAHAAGDEARRDNGEAYGPGRHDHEDNRAHGVGQEIRTWHLRALHDDPR